MPYQIRHSGGKFQVVTKGTGKVHGTHASQKQALAQMRAMYANVPDAKGQVSMDAIDRAAKKAKKSK